MIDSLVAAAVHDAKNALLVLDTQLAQAQSHPASADFSGARAQVMRVAAQLTELLTLYRSQNGQLRLTIDDCDLTDFLDDSACELGALPPGIELKIDRSVAVALGVWAFDAHLVKLALLDALRNALRHAKSEICFSLVREPGGGIRFIVVDDGPGYPAAVLAGEQAHAGNDGTGLGLSFARLIAATHATPDGRRGRLELANTPGACLALILP